MIITEVHMEASLIIWVSFKRESRYYIINYNFKILKGMYISNYIVKSLWSEVKWSEMKSLSHVRLFVTPWTVAYQAPPSMRFSRQECWSDLPFPSPGDFPYPGIEPWSPALQADALPSEPPGKPMIIKRGSTDTWNNIIYKLNWKIKEVVFWIKFKRENINIIYQGSPWITVFAQKSTL